MPPARVFCVPLPFCCATAATGQQCAVLTGRFLLSFRTHSRTHRQSINQSINQSIHPSSINQSSNQASKQLINQSINQSINPSINQSINQSINPSINQSKNLATFFVVRPLACAQAAQTSCWRSRSKHQYFGVAKHEQNLRQNVKRLWGAKSALAQHKAFLAVLRMKAELELSRLFNPVIFGTNLQGLSCCSYRRIPLCTALFVSKLL